MKNVFRNTLAALSLCAIASPAALATGPEVFTAQGCPKCHSVTAAGIQRAAEHDEEAPDLSHIGKTLDKKAIALFVLKKTEINGEKHKKKFQGTTDELKMVAEWLESLK